MTLREHVFARGPVQEQAAQVVSKLDVIVLCSAEEVRDVIAYWFSSLPARTAVAEDGYDAGRLLRDGSCRLLITDRVLPPWPGLDSFLSLRARNPRLRIAFVDNGSRDDRILARVTGARIFLAKPLSRQQVIGALTAPDAAA